MVPGERMQVQQQQQPQQRQEFQQQGEQAPQFVSVAIRVRPSASEEALVVWPTPEEGNDGQRRVCVHRGYVLEEYEFSRVFGPEDDNRRLFNELHGQRITASVFTGVNETLFAYGQTGSGKTHSIFGSRGESGLLQLFVHDLFRRAAASPGSTIHACCYEVLGDNLTDLVDAQPLVARGILRPEDVVCDELFVKTQKCRYQIVRVGSIEICLSLLHDARVNRAAGVSSCNNVSSRSHAVVHLFVQNPAANSGVKDEDGFEHGSGDESSSTIGALTLVDLAGTEKEHENPSEQGKKTARHINTSLSSLNRLLRKLQTGTLDESERRQSVLNKCLWEYMRPGCGIGMIFCVSPLLKHRTITLSTLSMATDSKLIHNQRRAQFIQLPASPALPAPEAQGRRSTGGGAIGTGPPPTPTQPMEERTPRRSSSGPGPTGGGGARTPRGMATAPGGSSGGGRARTPPATRRSPGGEFCLTPRASHRHEYSPAGCRRPSSGGGPGGSVPAMPRRGSNGGVGGGQAAPWGQPAAGWEDGVTRESWTTVDDMDQPFAVDGYSPKAIHDLAMQNTKLRQKLSRTRSKSKERAHRADRAVERLGAENASLQRECESLRQLFLRQQQQQIAFLTGPFMEMLAPKDGSSSGQNSVRATDDNGNPVPGDPWAAAAAVAATAAAAAAVVSGNGASGGSGVAPSLAPPQAPPMPSPPQDAFSGGGDAADPGMSRAESLRALSRERDYWRLMATELREMQSSASRGGFGRRSSVGSGGVDTCGGDDVSTSHGHDVEGSSESSDCSVPGRASHGARRGGGGGGGSSTLTSSASSLPGTSSMSCPGTFLLNGGPDGASVGAGGYAAVGLHPGGGATAAAMIPPAWPPRGAHSEHANHRYVVGGGAAGRYPVPVAGASG